MPKAAHGRQRQNNAEKHKILPTFEQDVGD